MPKLSAYWVAAIIFVSVMVGCGGEEKATAPPVIESSPTPLIFLPTIPASITPEPSLTPTPPCVPNQAWVDTYTVQAGDTLGAISIAAGVTLKDIQDGNCLADRDVLIVGQILRVPNAFSINIASSPDGAAGAVILLREGDLWTVKSDGGALRQITRGQIIISKPVRSPNMERVVFRIASVYHLPPALLTPTPSMTPTDSPTPSPSDQETTATTEPLATPSPASSSTPEIEDIAQAWFYDPAWLELPADIWSVGVDGNELREVVNQGAREAIYRSQPVWSPDSEWIAFTEQAGFVGALVMIRFDGTERAVIATDDFTAEGENVPTAPVWSPDGEKLAFVAWNESEKAQLHTVSPALRAEDVEVIVSDFAYADALLWLSEDEQSSLLMRVKNADLVEEWQIVDVENNGLLPYSGELALANHDGAYYLIQREGQTLLFGPHGRLQRDLPFELGALAWGPEGTQLIIERDLAGLLLIDFDEDIEANVTVTIDHWPVWSPPNWIQVP